MEYAAEAVRVGPSAHGQGVYALRALAADDLIGPIQGQIVDDPQYGSDYCIDLGDYSLEPAAPFRFLNHSCQPNAALVVYEEDDEAAAPGRLSLWLEVLREIAPGQQLTIDYAWSAAAAIPCGCGAAACRGWIVAAEDLAHVAALAGDLVASAQPA